MQQYASIYLLQNHSTCFGCPSNSSSGVHKSVTAASSTGRSIWATTFLQRGLKATLEEGFCSDTITCTRGCRNFLQRGQSHAGGRLLLRYYNLYQRLQNLPPTWPKPRWKKVVAQVLWPVPEAAEPSSNLAKATLEKGCYSDTMTCTRGCRTFLQRGL